MESLKSESELTMKNAGSSLVDFLYPEDGGDTFLRDVG
jgi:hypothetical protein